MKTKMMLTLGMMFIVVCSFARKPPISVQKAFAQKFPGTIHVCWIKEAPALWEAQFVVNGIKSYADFSQDGKWLETETFVPLSQIPNAAFSSIKQQGAGWEILDANRIETHTQDVIYAVDLRKGLTTKVLAFKEDGTRVQ